MKKQFMFRDNTVVCLFDDIESEAFLYLQKELPELIVSENEFKKYLKMPKSLVAKAICSPDDEFDRHYGMQLSAYRAELKFRTMIRKRVQRYLMVKQADILKQQTKLLKYVERVHRPKAPVSVK